jgi:hypothetical protein
MMLAKPTIRKFAMQCEAHGAQGPRQYMEYGEGASTAQHGNARKERIGEVAQACDGQRLRAAQDRRSSAANDETVHGVRRGMSEDATQWIERAVAERGGLHVA